MSGSDLHHLTVTEDPPDSEDQHKHDCRDRNPRPPLVSKRQRHVHSVETGQQGRRHQQHGHEGEDLHYVVLVQVDDTKDGILQVLEPLEREIGVIDQGMSNLTTRLAKNGSDYERAQNNIQRQSLNNLNVTKLVSREGDIDMSEAITDLKMLDYVHQATLSNAGKMYSSTLLDYLR